MSDLQKAKPRASTHPSSIHATLPLAASAPFAANAEDKTDPKAGGLEETMLAVREKTVSLFENLPDFPEKALATLRSESRWRRHLAFVDLCRGSRFASCRMVRIARTKQLLAQTLHVLVQSESIRSG